MWKQIEKEAKELDITVTQEKVDLGSQESTDEFIASFDGEIGGIIHSAGIIKDATLQNLTWEDCYDLYMSKHYPATFLHYALEKYEQPKLQFMWLFSSIAVYGSPGQINYSGSNSYLDSLGRYRQAMGKPCQVFQWGAWGEIGMAATLEAHLRRRIEMSMMPMFTNEEGLHGMECAIASGTPVNACLKFNANAAIESQKMDQQVVFEFTRNFYSEIFPPPIPKGLKRENLMAMIRSARGLYQWQKSNGWCVWYNTVFPRCLEDYGEEALELFDA